MANYKTEVTEEFVPPKIVAPADDDDPHYVKSFRPEQRDEYTKFFEEYGFVVVRDVLDKAECEATIDDIWTYIAFRKHPMFDDKHTIKRDDPNTWDNCWPSMAEEGIVGCPPVFCRAALNNRQNPKVHDVFSTLLGTKSLMVNHDRYGLFRSTRNADGHPCNSHWKTTRNIHLDMNPWRYMGLTGSQDGKPLVGLNYKHDMEFIAENNELGFYQDGLLHVQGLINIADNCAEDGGFQIVPGFGRKYFEEWTRSTQATLCKRYLRQQTFIVIPDDSPLMKHAQRVTARAGSLVVWDQRTLHGSAPNDSSNIRYAQFIKMSPAVDLETERGQKRKEAVTKKLAREGFEPSDLGQKLFTLEPWL